MVSDQRIYVRRPRIISVTGGLEVGAARTQLQLFLASGSKEQRSGGQSPDDTRDPLGDVTDGRRWL